MRSDRRFLAGTIPVVTLAGGIAGALIFGGSSRPVAAQSPVAMTNEQRTAATALEGAFMRIADSAGPATVRITAVSPPPQRTRRSDGNGDAPNSSNTFKPNTDKPNAGGSDSDDDNSIDAFPFQFFGAPGNRFSQRQAGPSTAYGSGVIIRADGWILTNDHVVENAADGKVKVILSDNTEYSGKVYRDPSADLAVVKITAPKPLPFVRIADSSRLHVGQWAIAIGSPLAEQNTMTTGIVSALHRNRQIADESLASARFYTDMIQTDAAINFGNSGGPLLNIDGELIGINVAIIAGSNGVGFAIPANTAKQVADQLIANGKVTRSSLGVVPGDVPPGLRAHLGVTQGAYVDQVAADTPADKAGIEPGDVITRFGSTDVTDENALRNAITFASPGTTVPITLLREGKTVNTQATLVKREETLASGNSRPGTTERHPAIALGITGRVLTADQLKENGFPADTTGVMVTSVMPGSPAADGNLSRGTIVTAVNGKPIKTLEELNAAVASAKSGDIIPLKILIPMADARPSRGIVNIQIP